MAHVYLDRTDDNRFKVLVCTGFVGRKEKVFDTHAAAETFAISKMDRRGMILDTTNLTPEQLAELRAKEQRVRDMMRQVEGPRA